MESKDQDIPSYLPMSIPSGPAVAGAMCVTNLDLLNQQLSRFKSFKDFWEQNKRSIIHNPLPKYL